MKKTIATVEVLSFLFLTVACTDSLDENTTSTVYDTETELTYSDWTEESHSKNGDRNYDMVFNQEVVQRIDLVISATNWASMQAKYDSWAALIKPYAIAERSGYTYLASSGRNGSLSSAFDSNISAMKSQVTTRSNAVDSYLSFSTSTDSKVLLQKNDNRIIPAMTGGILKGGLALTT